MKTQTNFEDESYKQELEELFLLALKFQEVKEQLQLADKNVTNILQRLPLERSKQ